VPSPATSRLLSLSSTPVRHSTPQPHGKREEESAASGLEQGLVAKE
jgi:hypothetical protein